MSMSFKFAAAVLAAGLTAAALGTTEASAAPRCYSAVDGAATATGILGTGTEKARIEARRVWSATVENLYGPRYANFRNAVDRRWDCKKGAILLAKCVAVAKPCRY